MEFSRQEYSTGYPFPSPGDPANPGIKPRSPALQADSSPSESHLGSPALQKGMSTSADIMKNSMEIAQKIKTINYHITQQFHFLVFTQRNQNHYFENISTLQCSMQQFLQLLRHGNKRSSRDLFLMWHVHDWKLSNNKKKEILPFVTTWLGEGIILSEVRQRKTYTNTVWPHLYVDSGRKIKNKKMEPKSQIQRRN